MIDIKDRVFKKTIIVIMISLLIFGYFINQYRIKRYFLNSIDLSSESFHGIKIGDNIDNKIFKERYKNHIFDRYKEKDMDIRVVRYDKEKPELVFRSNNNKIKSISILYDIDKENTIWKTIKGVDVNFNRDSIIDLYGEDYYMENGASSENTMIYLDKKNDLELRFGFYNDKLYYYKLKDIYAEY